MKRKSYSYTIGTLPTSADTTYSYGYSSGTWGDQLTTYRGKTLTYDALGNPLYYHNGYGFGKNFTWTGRQLTGMTQSSTTQSFTYDYDIVDFDEERAAEYAVIAIKVTVAVAISILLYELIKNFGMVGAAAM